MTPVFKYDPEILHDFPQLRTGWLVAKDVEVVSSPPALQSLFQAAQKDAIQRYQGLPVADIPSLEAWRKAFRRFGVNPTKYRSAPEALLRRLLKKGSLPLINTVVDICNLVSVQNALPIAAFDLHMVEGGITVRYARGDERFMPLGSETSEPPVPGEVIFVDEKGMVVARRWCWRQSQESATTKQTHHLLLTIEGMHASAEEDVSKVLQEVLKLLTAFVPGSYQSGAPGVAV